jgi:hypothetical protein
MSDREKERVMPSIKQREEQLLALTELEREEGNESNPILFAEAGPNRFNILTFFFPEGDGVKIQTDLDLDETSVEYFNDSETIELTEGLIYDWAIDLYEND